MDKVFVFRKINEVRLFLTLGFSIYELFQKLLVLFILNPSWLEIPSRVETVFL